MRWGKPPSSLILGTESKGKWDSKWDTLVAEAYEIVQREKCPQCGLPRWICGNDSEDVQFHVNQESCVAIVKKDEKEAQLTKVGKKVDSGTILRPEPYMVDKTRDLVELREPYYKAQYKKAHPAAEPEG